MKERLYRFFVRDDAEYDTLVQQYQAKTLLGKFFYLFMHVLPGLLAYVLINIPLVHAAPLRFTGLSAPLFQGNVPDRSRLRVARGGSTGGPTLGG